MNCKRDEEETKKEEESKETKKVIPLFNPALLFLSSSNSLTIITSVIV